MKKAKIVIYIKVYHYVNSCNLLFEELKGIRFRKLFGRLDYYDKILRVHESSEVTKYFALIEIMDECKKDFSNRLEIRNSLLLLINLCLDIKNPDYLFNKGKLMNELSKLEKDHLFEILKYEFNIH